MHASLCFNCLVFYKDLRILYSHDKRKLSNGQLWKIWKETALIELWSYFIDVLAFRTRQIMPRGGDFVSFSRSGGQSFALKSCPRGGDSEGKYYWPWGQPGGDGNWSN